MKRFETSGAPYLQPEASVSQMMTRLLLSLVPAAAVYTWFFGPGLLLNILVASAVGLMAEAMVLNLRKRPLKPYLGDGSVLVTAVLFAWCLPPATPWWITATGMIFAVVFAKHLYGGLGHNPFNPAMAGYVLVLISFPQEMTRWLPITALASNGPDALQTLWATFAGELGGDLQWDAVTMATPLDYVKTELARLTTMPEIKSHVMFGDFAGRGYEWVGNFIALGGAWMIYKNVIRWHIPVAVIAGVLIPATLAYMVDPGSNGSPGLHLFSGATLLGAFYIATDPVSAATSPRGRLVFGLGVGVITFVVRKWGGYPDGIAFGVLLMNAAAPLIDHFTRPRVYGNEQ